MHSGQHMNCKVCGKIRVLEVTELAENMKQDWGTEKGRARMKEASSKRINNLRPMRKVEDWIER